MLRVSIKIMPLDNEEFYIYNEDYLRAMATQEERRTAYTRKGLEQLILTDLSSHQGEFYNLLVTQQAASKNILILKEKLISAIKDNQLGNIAIKFNNKDQIDEIWLSTFQRVEAVEENLTLLTTIMKLFGHTNIPIVVQDTSNDDFYARNEEALQKFRAKGFKVGHLGQRKMVEVKSALWKSSIMTIACN